MQQKKKQKAAQAQNTESVTEKLEDIFERDRVIYTFREQCAEEPDLLLEDGATKVFLNMTSRNGRQELVSLLQYMKHTTLENPDITVMDDRILDLDRIVTEVKQSEEWEVVKMSILEIGLERGMQQGIQQGIQQGSSQTLVKNVELAMKNFGITLQKACYGLGVTMKEYEDAKSQLALSDK